MGKVKIHVGTSEKRSSDPTKSKLVIKPVESREKTRGVKKVSLCDDNS